VTDVVPDGLTYLFGFAPAFTCPAGPINSGSPVVCSANGPLANGAKADIFFTYTIGDTVPFNNKVDNIATVKGAEYDPPSNPSNDASEAITSVNPVAKLTFTKTTAKGPNEVVNFNDLVTYTLTVVNTGPSTATNVVVADQLPLGLGPVSTNGCTIVSNVAPWVYSCSMGNIAPGGKATATITVQVGFAGAKADNVATVTADDSTQQQATATIVVPAETDVEVTKVAQVNGQ